MSQFGLPQRNATSDANAGVVNPPSVKHTPRQVATKQKPPSSLDTGVEQLGAALGAALEERLETEATNINEQRATDAAIRQGQEHAINQIDATKKRTGWEKAIFGENIEYRAAQQRAAQNAVNAAYLEQATTLDQYAGETPDEYSIRLKEGLDKVLEPYKDDTETKRIVTQAWMVSSGKLAAKHYEAHYAFNQTQQRDTYSKQVQQTFDTWTVDASLVSTPEEAQGMLKVSQAFFAKATKPEGMTDLAWRSVVNEQLMNSLRKGNIGAYNTAKANGWLQGLNVNEQVAMDRAVSAYDTDFSQKVALTYENAELAALEAKTFEGASAIYQNLREQLDTLGNRSSGTERAELALARGHKSAQKGLNAISDARAKAEAEAAKIARKAAEKASEAQAEQQRIDLMKEALRNEDPIARAGVLNEVDPKKSELEDALDITIVEDISRLAGSPEQLTPTEATKVLLEDPKVAQAIAQRMRGQEVDSPFIKRTIETFINVFQGLVNEDGQLNDRGVVAMQAVAQFEQNEDTFKSMIGNDNYDRYEIIRRGMSIGQTSEMVMKDLDAYAANKGNRDVYGIQWELGENESKRDRIQSLVQGFTGQVPRGTSLAHYMEEYDRALVIYKGDRKAAESYLRKSALNAAINYKGRVITNGKHLNNVTSYNFQQLMDGAQKSTGDSASLLTPYLATLGVALEDKDGKPLTTIEQVRGLNIYTIDGLDGFFLDSQEAQAPVQITPDVMKRWEQTLNQRANFQKLQDKADKEFLDKWMEEQRMLQLANPMMFP